MRYATLLLSIKDWAGKLFNVVMGFILTVYFILEGDNAYRGFFRLFRRGNGSGWTGRCSEPKCAWANGCWGRAA